MFNLNKCSTAIAAAMVGTIRTGDDASRFAQRAMAEGFNNISDLIAFDAVKQAVAIRAAIYAVDPLHNATSPAALDVPKVEPVTVTSTTLEDDEVLPFAPLDAPAPPAAEQAAITSTNTTSDTAGTVAVDSEGLPWDGRIHSSNKKKLSKDNTWQLRRGIDPATVEQVKGELRQVMAIPKIDASTATAPVSTTSTDTPPSAPSVPAPETQGLHPDANAFSVATVNTLTAAGNSVPTAPATTPQTGVSSKPYAEYKLPDLMRGITSKMITPDVVQSVVAQFGVPSVPALATRPDLIPLVAEALAL